MTQQCDERRLATADATAVFNEHRTALERLAARLTGDREDARDVVADAFAALLEAGPSEPSHAVAWLYLTVRHRAYNRIRDRTRARRRLPALAAQAAAPLGPESVLRHDARVQHLLAAAAEHLSERDRVAVLLRHLEHAPYADVATALGTSPAQARVVVHRATTRLRHHVVASLSHRHKARDTCMSSLAERGRHDGCTGCTALSDELIALLQGAVVLPLSGPARMTNAVRDWWRRTQSATVRAAAYVGEAFGPAVALAAMAAAPAAPTVPVAEAATTQPVTAVAAPAGPAVDAEAAARATGHAPAAEAPNLSAALPRPPLAPPGTTTIGVPLVGDDPGTSPGLTDSITQQRRSFLDILGLPVDIPDPLDAPQGPSVDIRSLEVATLGGADGRPSAVRWRVAFMEAPPANVGVGLSWGFDGSNCHASFSWPSSNVVAVYCPDYRIADVTLMFREATRLRVDVRLDGTALEVTLPFSSLDDVGRSFFRPGARLVRMTASASCYVNYVERSGCENGDRAPDDWNGYNYRVEE